MNHILKTQRQIAERRAATIARAAYRAAFERRLDPASYNCRRDGAAWVAEGAGQRFEFSKADAEHILCMSHSGGIYFLPRQENGSYCCDCKAREQSNTCKHEVAWEAVLMAHRMERETARAELSAEAAELSRLRAEGEDAERAVRAEWAVANGAGL